MKMLWAAALLLAAIFVVAPRAEAAVVMPGPDGVLRWDGEVVVVEVPARRVDATAPPFVLAGEAEPSRPPPAVASASLPAGVFLFGMMLSAIAVAWIGGGTQRRCTDAPAPLTSK